jgi:hypothetical protein
MLGEQEAILIRPPAGVATANNPRAITNISFTNTSTTAQALPSSGLNIHGCWVAFKSNQDCRLRVEDANVGAATSSDYLLKANDEKSWWCSSVSETHVRVIRDSADGVLQVYRNGV